MMPEPPRLSATEEECQSGQARMPEPPRLSATAAGRSGQSHRGQVPRRPGDDGQSRIGGLLQRACDDGRAAEAEDQSERAMMREARTQYHIGLAMMPESQKLSATAGWR
jgi:hypothetical protein